MSLRWSRSYDGRLYFAMCGKVTVGVIGEEDDGRWSWFLYDTLIKAHARTKGKRPAPDLAKRSLEVQWDRWLAAAGLQHTKSGGDFPEEDRLDLFPANER